MNHYESQLQAECFKYFRLKYPKLTVFAIENGGKRNYVTAARLKKQGVMAGVADAFLMYPTKDKHGLFIEFKYGNNKQTKQQKTFEEICNLNGYHYSLVYSFDEFIKTIDDYLTL